MWEHTPSASTGSSPDGCRLNTSTIEIGVGSRCVSRPPSIFRRLQRLRKTYVPSVIWLGHDFQETSRLQCIRHVLADTRNSIHNHLKSVRVKTLHVREHVDNVPWPGFFQGETISVQGSFPNDVVCGLDHKSVLLRILEKQDT